MRADVVERSEMIFKCSHLTELWSEAVPSKAGAGVEQVKAGTNEIQVIDFQSGGKKRRQAV